jgi:ABC-type Mn2+/Zn2+ transport system permease subunit
MRLLLRSRTANVALTALGVIYTIGALLVLVWLTRDVWEASTMADKLLQFALVIAAICGAAFLLLGTRNLRQVSGTSKPASIQR